MCPVLALEHTQLSFSWSEFRKGGGQNAWRITGRGTTEGTLGTYPCLGTEMLSPYQAQIRDMMGPLTGPCWSPTLFKEEMAKRNTVLTVRNLQGTSSRGSKGALERASRTTAKSQVGILGRTGGLSLLVPPEKNRVTNGFLPRDCSPTGAWWAAIAAT